ncbi:glycosyltransferase family 9 protein [Seleniivibrio woodruffii]|uniref:glycosyltransferase family 9 protein n=1 Tax=Seleniivibrio woodruffii TaxID=1078050 RepID=UPI0026EF87A2|nr:glycosyltransferase family 9 protein [Seleniivibrio woodruffii]
MFIKRTGRFSRFLDRSAGVLFLILLSIFVKKRKKSEKPESFCFVKTGGVGDMVLVSAVIKQVRAKYPSADMTLVCSPENRAMAELMTDSRVLTVSYRNPVQWFTLRKLKTFDVLIDFGAWTRFDALISLFIPARFRLGFRTAGQHRHYCYDSTVKHDRNRHELDNFYTLAELYCAQTGVLPQYKAEKNEIYKDIVIMHMYCSGARYMCRMWNFENWKKLGILIKNSGFYLGFTASGAESVHLKAFLRSEGIDALIITDRSPGELASKFNSCRGIISVNCGISHFAAACGGKVVELTGSVNPKRWGASGENVLHVVPPDVRKNLCYGYENDADEYSMDRVAPEEVFETVKKVFPL